MPVSNLSDISYGTEKTEIEIVYLTSSQYLEL